MLHTDIHTDIHTDSASDEAGPRGAFAPNNKTILMLSVRQRNYNFFNPGFRSSELSGLVCNKYISEFSGLVCNKYIFFIT